MPTADKPTARESIHGTLTQRAGGAPDANAVVDAVVRTWRYMAVQLEPVIGVRGVNVLFDRSLHLTGKLFPWLVHAGTLEDAADPLASLRARFASRDALEAAEAGCALLVTFTEQLANLIGESLTERLLASVWIAAPPTSDEENPHE